MTQTLPREPLAQRREAIYRRTPERRVTSVEAARDFVAEVGFCHFWPIKGVETPNLFHAIAGRVRDVPNEHGDPDLSRCWGWKDASLDKRWWYYGKLLRRRATLVSLELLPHFYAASENFGELTDYLDEYRDGHLTAEAKAIYEAILEHGPLNTIRLRRESRMSAGSAKSRFDRALMELQVGLKVLPVAVAEAGAWRYAFVYEILQRHFPELPAQAREISRRRAQRTLIQTYVDNVVWTERAMITKVFHVMRWGKREIQRAIAALVEEGALVEAEVAGLAEAQLVSARAL